MAHRKVDAPLTQATHTNSYDISPSHAESTLRDFSKCVVALRSILYHDRLLTRVEFLFMKQHLRVLQMTYLRLKRKQEGPMGLHCNGV